MVDTSRSCRSAPNIVILFGESCDHDLTEVDRPDAVLDLIKSHIVALKWRGQEEYAASETKRAAAGDALHEIVPGILDRGQASRVLAW
jgi:hypothetical protein